MKNLYLSILATLICIVSSYAATLEKTQRQTFAKADSKGTMAIDSRYGNINISEWDRDYAEINVRIEVKSKKEEDARKRLDGINISFTEKGNSAYAKTEIGSGNFRNTEFSITYTVSIPKGMKLNIDNKYGNLVTGNLDGQLTANIKYGNVTSGELNARGNTIDIQYGNVNIVNAPEVKIKMSYGNVKARNIAELNIETKYSHIKIDYIGTLEIKGSAYDNFNISEAVNIRAKTGMGGIDVGTLHKRLELSGVKYGNVNVKNVSAGFEFIKINSSYATVDIAFEQPLFNYNLSTRYGKVNFSGFEHTVSHKNSTHTSEEYTGKAGNLTDKKITVDISASYGNINLRKK